MSIMQQYEQSSALFGSNAPFIEEQYEIYLANPGAVSADWRAYFDRLRDGAPDVAHAPVIDSPRRGADREAVIESSKRYGR